MLNFLCVEPDMRKELKCALHWVTNSNTGSQMVTNSNTGSQMVTNSNTGSHTG
jgi:hypothetical protein